MKRWFLFVFVLIFEIATGLADSPIAEVKLTDGRLLHLVEIKSFSRTAILAKWEGGAGTLAYELLPMDLRIQLEQFIPPQKSRSATEMTTQQSQVEKKRVEERAKKAAFDIEQASADAYQKKNRKISGQVFIATRGRQNVKLGSATIHFVPSDEMDRYFIRKPPPKNYYDLIDDPYSLSARAQGEAELAAYLDGAPKGSLDVRTDAEGHFEISIPARQKFYLSAIESRLIAGANEQYLWCILVEEGEDEFAVNLNNANFWQPPKG